MVDVYLSLATDRIIKSFDHSDTAFIDVGKPKLLRTRKECSLNNFSDFFNPCVGMKQQNKFPYNNNISKLLLIKLVLYGKDIFHNAWLSSERLLMVITPNEN
jgi:hypothetical protein